MIHLMSTSEQASSTLREMGIQLPSLMSVRITMTCKNHVTEGDLKLAQGTGFLFNWQDRPYLVTNRHNLTGRRQDDGSPLNRHGATPDTVHIAHNLSPRGETEAGQFSLGWESVPEILLDDSTGDHRWFEHPSLGAHVDVVVLPISRVPNGGMMLAYTTNGFSQPIGVGPSQDLSIVGFPFGESSGGNVAVWVRGSVASEPVMDHGGLPRFLIDARTRPGQSGSPVIIYSASGVVNDAGGITVGVGPHQRLVGVYSGRTNEQSDLGLVWKASTIVDILSAADTASLPPVTGLAAWANVDSPR